MATTVTKTRTNYFGVKDKAAFAAMVENLVTNDDKAFLFENSRGEVGFAADGSIFGVIPDNAHRKIPKHALEELKDELMIDYTLAESKEINKFVGTSVEDWEEDKVKQFLDEVIEQKSNKELAEAVAYYIGLPDPEPDEMETEMIHQIQSLIAPGHACIITDVSYENLKCLNGAVLVITQDKYQTKTLDDIGLQMARDMLDMSNYSPDMAY